MVDRVNELRAQETRRREEFMKLHGVKLPPNFLEAVPSLRDKPPHFAPVTGPLEELPSVQVVEEEVESSQAMLVGAAPSYVEATVGPEAVDAAVTVGDSLLVKAETVDEAIGPDEPFSSQEEPLSQAIARIKELVNSPACIAFRQDLGATIASPSTPAQLESTATGIVLEEVVGGVEELVEAVAKKTQHPMLALMDFKVGDVALFMPAFTASNKRIWMAFNSGYPHRFLSEVSACHRRACIPSN